MKDKLVKCHADTVLLAIESLTNLSTLFTEGQKSSMLKIAGELKDSVTGQLSESELIEAIENADARIVRSQADQKQAVIEKAKAAGLSDEDLRLLTN